MAMYSPSPPEPDRWGYNLAKISVAVILLCLMFLILGIR